MKVMYYLLGTAMIVAAAEAFGRGLLWMLSLLP